LRAYYPCGYHYRKKEEEEQGTTATGTVLMVLVLFFAVLFGIWSPIVNKQDDLFLRPSSNNNDRHQSSSNGLGSSASAQNQDRNGNRLTATTKSILDQQDMIKQEPTTSSSVAFSDYTTSFKSRVLLSTDEQLHQMYENEKTSGPYLPKINKFI